MEESGNTIVVENESGVTVTASTINHELNQYDYAEGIEFIGLVPKMIESGVKGIGGSDNSVKSFGFDAKGSDELEVVDFEAFFDEKEGDNGQ